MVSRVLSHQELEIACEEDISVVRRRVRELARKRGFNAFATAAITTATSELSRNVWVHAHRGKATIEEIEDERERTGLRVAFDDEGPGIADLERALSGGFSTARSLGLGLSGSRRLVDEFQIETVMGRGTQIEVVKWKRAV